jgi:hypothetical protein
MWLPPQAYPGQPEGSSNLDKRFYRPDMSIKGDDTWTKLNDLPVTNNALVVGGLSVNLAAATGTSAGFSAKALEGQQKGGLNLANTPTTANTLALDIE